MNEKQKIIGQGRIFPQIEPREETQWQLSERRKNRQQRLQELRSNGSQIKLYKSPTKYSNQQKHSVSPIKKTEPKKPKPPNNLGSIYGFLCITLLVIVPTGAGITAMSALFKLPSQADCESTYWRTASASKRLYCAQLLATSSTVDSLLQAINLVDVLSNDHPMRPQIDGYIEKWSKKILSLGDLAFQDGKLEEAITIAQKVPQKVPAYPLVEKQIQDWQKTWNEAEGNYTQTQEHLRQEEWHQASMEASRLLSVPNVYWGTKKYQELINDLKRTRKESAKLNEAQDIGEKGGLDNLTNGIQQAQEIEQKSYIYQKAQKLVLNFGKKIVDIALIKLNEGNWQEALDVVNKVPNNDALKEKVEDIEVLARAYSPANLGTVAGLEDAIAQVEKLKAERPLYSKAQELISLWQQEISDVTIIEEGKKLAQPGGISDLKVAIAKLQTIPPYNPRGQDATTLIKAWNRELQQQEDRPFLEKAEKLASFGDLSSLQAAISEARQIGRGRTLYQEAQNKIKRWTEKVQRFEDQPILDDAQILALSGNIEQAIFTARKIRAGRVLYNQARAKIQEWQVQLEAKRSLENARQVAAGATADAYVTAISLAQQVPSYSSRQVEASQLINQWSQQILFIAMEVVNRDVPQAISIARKIPRNSLAYNSAQSQISIWQSWLTPTQPIEDRSLPSNQSQQLREENSTNLTDERGKPLVSKPKFTDNN
ncbi:MAG: hypothetical protein F6K40_22250 [Okeania sp. SIO3I5]|uniref:hypothetical protein n=1 Tax=Okeania sp. SIO3I5 TaxID=2607805 RepID=UPI0013BABE31|nr:hypothetical protein [Okeania sp. SIO3I5]NEQ38843.1 hypothetical protein [Okeania sp. SIO3I5]